MKIVTCIECRATWIMGQREACDCYDGDVVIDDVTEENAADARDLLAAYNEMIQ